MIRHGILVGCLAVLLSGTRADLARGDDAADAAAAAQAIAPFLDDEAFGIVRIDLQKTTAESLEVLTERLTQLNAFGRTRLFPSEAEVNAPVTGSRGRRQRPVCGLEFRRSGRRAAADGCARAERGQRRRDPADVNRNTTQALTRLGTGRNHARRNRAG